MTVRLAHALEFGVLAPLSGRYLVIGAQRPQDIAALPQAGLRVQQGDFMAHAALRLAGIEVAPAVTGAFAGALVFAAQNREQTFGHIAQAAQMVAVGGQVLLEGAKTDGIDALARSLKKVGLSVESHAKAHGKLVWFIRPQSLPDVFGDWARSAAPSQIDGGFTTAPGMFSHAKPDAGSLFLAEYLPHDLTGAVADFGAGWGWLSAQILAQNPGIEALHLIEADHDALVAARINVADSRARFHWGDATQDAALGVFKTVIMNPPFHRQGATDPDLGRAFITSAAAQLAPSGQLILVANRQLPYEPTLDGLFGHVETLAQNGVYKVIAASRPKRRGK